MNGRRQKLELNWIGKDEELKLEPRVLIQDSEKSCGDPQTENMLIHGDNLLALKALEQDFAGKIKCIYIDPPYNTGNAFEHYDDGLEHSLWLSLMKPRLEILRNLLSNDGSIWISIDENEGHYLKVMCDEIFGRKNFIIQTAIQRGAATGHKAINPTPVQVCDYMLTYAKDKTCWQYQQVYQERTYDEAYSKFIDNYEDQYEAWRFINLKDALKKHSLTLNEALQKYADRIIRFAQPNYEGVGQKTRDLIDESKKDHTKIHLLKRDGYPDIYLWKGDRILFYKDKMREIDGNLVTSELVTNIWLDMNYQGTAKEGNVIFPKGKKPETQIRRILLMSTNESDIVLDSFLGSGTTAAVAHKMGRRWIGVELGDHCYSHCLPRLQRVCDGTDQNGISKAVKWKGGGGFKFYELAPSLLRKDKFGNWVIDEKVNANMLAAAMCKHEGFKFFPDSEVYWKQGRSTETDYIFVTTSFATIEQLDRIHEEMKQGESLLICAKAFAPGCKERHSNITIKKIPQVVLGKCEFGKNNYDLNIINSAMETDEDMEEDE